jgi:hypothetical protein
VVQEAEAAVAAARETLNITIAKAAAASVWAIGLVVRVAAMAITPVSMETSY